MIAANVLTACEISQRARDLQDSIIRTRAKILIRHRLFQETRRLTIEFAMFANQPWRHRTVGVNAFILRKPFTLNRTHLLNTRTDRRRILRCFF